MKARLGQNDGGQDDRRCLNHSPSSFCPLIVLPVIAWRNGSGLKLTEHQLIAATKSWLNDTDPVALARSVREERNGHERQTKRLVESIESLTIARPGFEPGQTEPKSLPAIPTMFDYVRLAVEF